MWGFAIRHGFDEIDDPWHHRDVTQHAYLEGNDDVALCGFRPPQSGPRARRRARLGLPTDGIHPLCGTCARMVAAPRRRARLDTVLGRPAVAVPVTPGAFARGDPPAIAVAPAPRIAIPVTWGDAKPAGLPRPGSTGSLGSRGVQVKIKED
jgi:hypothetical protein